MGENESAWWSTDDSLDLSALTARESEVLGAAAEGLSARAIASRFSISEATVRSHLATIYSKVGVSGRVELLARLHHRAAPPSVPPPTSSSLPLRDRVRVAVVRWRWWLGLGVAVLLVFIGFLAWRPDLPPRTDLSTVARLLDEGKLQALDLRGETLTVVENDGDRLRVEDVSGADFDPIFREALARGAQGVTASGDGNGLLQLVTALAVMMLPPVGLLLFTVLLVRIVRGPPRHASSS